MQKSSSLSITVCSTKRTFSTRCTLPRRNTACYFTGLFYCTHFEAQRCEWNLVPLEFCWFIPRIQCRFEWILLKIVHSIAKYFRCWYESIVRGANWQSIFALQNTGHEVSHFETSIYFYAFNPFSVSFSIGGSSGKFRVQRVDHGMPHRADICDIGQLEREYHKTFPIQSINLCLLELTPWNEQNWSVDDTDYVKKLVGNGSFEITIFNEVYSELIFTKNLISRNPNTDVICVDYAKHIISKGIASKKKTGLKEFFDHLIVDHCLCVIPTD